MILKKQVKNLKRQAKNKSLSTTKTQPTKEDCK